MYCEKCGNNLPADAKFCDKCGQKILEKNQQKETNQAVTSSIPYATQKTNKGNYFKKILKIGVIIFIVSWIIYANIDDDSVQKNNYALSDINTGDTINAAQKLREAANDAVSTETKITILKNLGFVYSTDRQDDLALGSFKEALALCDKNTFDYYLISGEIALLENKPLDAQTNYNKAYQIKPNDYQINNSLALFYLDLDDLAPLYADRPKALTYAQKAYELSDSSVKNISQQNLAVAQFFNKNYSQAVSLLSTTNFNEHPHMALWLGLSYAGLEDYENAKTYLQKAKNLGVDIGQDLEKFLKEDDPSYIDPVAEADYNEGYKSGYVDGRSSHGNLGDNYAEPATEERKGAYFIGYLEGFLKGCREGNFDCSEVESAINNLYQDTETDVNLIPSTAY